MQDYLKFQIGTALVKDGVCKLPYASIIEALTPAYFPEHYRFGGVAHPGTTPAKIFGPTMYVAVDVGVYNGFSNHSVGMNEVALFTSSDGGVWDKWVVVSDCCDDINYPVEPTPPTPGPDLSEPLTFEAKEDNTLIKAVFQDEEDESATRTLLYSLDSGATWESATIGQALATLATLNTGETIQFKGDNFCPGGMIVTERPGGGEIPAAPFYAYGNMMSLLSAEGFEDLTEVPEYAFDSFFDSSLVDIKPDHRLLLPATTLAEGCYAFMFSGCTELTSAPELPATTLAASCYPNMFSGCTSLTTAPELPATTLADHCYVSMFSGCTNLSEVKCYAEDISAQYCVKDWLKDVAATGTFYRSENNNDWPIDNQSGIPQGWTIIPPTPGPDLSEPFTIEAKEDNTPITAFSRGEEKTLLYSLDNGATWQSASIGATPATLATLNAGETIRFRGDNIAPDCLVFAGTKSRMIPEYRACYIYGNLMSLLSAENFETLSEAPEQCFQNYFYSSLVDIKPDHRLLLPATTLAEFCYYGMFGDCTGLTAAPELPATTLAESCYQEMFRGCTSLAAAPELPATTLAVSCYQEMFGGCTSLAAAPELKATTLAANCYALMFGNCTNLSEVKCLAEDISAEFCVSNWLDGVAASGTFYRSENNNAWEIDNPSGIPQGWTLVPPISVSPA